MDRSDCILTCLVRLDQHRFPCTFLACAIGMLQVHGVFEAGAHSAVSCCWRQAIYIVINIIIISCCWTRALAGAGQRPETPTPESPARGRGGGQLSSPTPSRVHLPPRLRLTWARENSPHAVICHMPNDTDSCHVFVISINNTYPCNGTPSPKSLIKPTHHPASSTSHVFAPQGDNGDNGKLARTHSHGQPDKKN